MKALRRSLRRFLDLFRNSGEDELAAELESHIEMQVEDNVRGGMSPEEARRQAAIKFGGLDAAKEMYRDQRGVVFLETAIGDFRQAARTLLRNPGFSVVAVLTLAGGIGVNTAVFSLVDQVLIHPPGIDDADRVVAAVTRYGNQGRGTTISSPRTFRDIHEGREIFEHAAFSDGSGSGANYIAGDTVDRLYAPGVSAEWFDVFGARPMLGRVFTEEEDKPGANRVVVLSHATWMRLFGGDRAVIGRTMSLTGEPYQIIGVMNPEFRVPRNVDLWRPAALPAPLFDQRFNERLFIAARLRPEVSLAQARSWLNVLSNRVRNGGDQIESGVQARAWSVSALPFTDSEAGTNKTFLLLLLGAVGFVLLIVCANIAGLMIARTSARARELAVRAALGASRVRLWRGALSESVLLALAGGLAGLAVATAAVPLLSLLAPAGASTARLDLNVLGFCVAATLASVLFFGLAPAWQVSRFYPKGALQGEGRTNTAESTRQRLRSLLVVGETALALTLLITAGLFVRSLVSLQAVNPGFNPEGVMTATFSVPSSNYPRILERVRAAPGVTAAGFVWPIPFSYNNQGGVFAIEGRTVSPTDPLPNADRRRITPGYMEAMSIPLKRGRYFTENDHANAEPVTMIDENLAVRYWPNENPLGQRIRLGPPGTPTFTIVGVVGHVAHPDVVNDTGTGVYYLSLLQDQRTGSAGIIVKTSRDPLALVGVIREAVRSVDPSQPVFSLNTMEDYVAASLANRRFVTRLLGFFAASALFLAALGLYGVISYGVTQRRREIGIRVALGAGRSSVMKLFVGQGFRLAAIGVGIGIVASAYIGRLIESHLYQVASFDPATVAGMAAMLLLGALLASYLPARRALRVEPVVTLRHE
jgi:predicted permease